MKRNALFAASLLALGLLGGAATAATPAASTPPPPSRNASNSTSTATAPSTARSGEVPALRRALRPDRQEPRRSHHAPTSVRNAAQARPRQRPTRRHRRGSTPTATAAWPAKNSPTKAGSGGLRRDGCQSRWLPRPQRGSAYHDKQRPLRRPSMPSGRCRVRGADLNRDGKLSRVEVDGKMPRAAKSFAWKDDNKDGFLSRTELQPSHHR